MLKRKIPILMALMIAVSVTVRPESIKSRMPELSGIKCEGWFGYIDDVIEWRVQSCTYQGHNSRTQCELSQDTLLNRQQAGNRTTDYLTGLMDAYEWASLVSKNDYLHTPFSLDTYREKIKEYCENPENSGVEISAALINVNNEYKKEVSTGVFGK